MYSSYTAAVMPRHLDLAAKYGVNLRGAVTWAFEFEDQPWFDGFRDLATNGIGKPVLNVHRMLGMMTGDRAAVRNPGALPLDTIVSSGVKEQPDVYALASIDTHSGAVLISNYHDSGRPGPAAPIELAIAGLSSRRVLLHHYRVDSAHSNSYEAWKRMGSPQSPSPEQYAQLERDGQLALMESPRWAIPENGSVRVAFQLPRHGVSLIRLTW
jgi:xylan 1,4-beta-xylosidase